MVLKKVDILIVGGGLIGATLLLALKKSGFNAYLVEERQLALSPTVDFDTRSLALAPASMRILKMLGAWELLLPYLCEIKTIHVSAKDCFGIVKLQQKQEALGYTVEMPHINSTINTLIENDNILTPAKLIDLDTSNNIAKINVNNEEISLQYQLMVAADGSNSSVRKFCGLTVQLNDFKQDAIVANIKLQRSHHNFAFERFTENGPLALLPLNNNRSALIWSMDPSKAKHFLQCSQPEFISVLQKNFGYRLGRITQVGKRTTFPLKQVSMATQIYKSIVFIGNAANTLHPVAGQGFNLGLRDVAMLAQCIGQFGLNAGMLENYQQNRKIDQRNILQLTNLLVNLFSFKLPGFNVMRSLGLLSFAHIEFLKKELSRYSSGFGGKVADLVCGIPL